MPALIQWVTIFDVAAQPFRWGNAGEGLAALALVALGAAASLALGRRGVRGGTTILAIAAGLAVFFAVRTVDHRREHTACVAAERNGDGSVIQGVVTDFRPLDSLWHRPWSESFRVNDVRVEYPVLAESCGFHRSAVERGQIRDGLHVRLREWKGIILKLEIEANALVSSPQENRPP